MADRFPLIANSSANQIQELAASDNLNITSSSLVSSGIVTVSAPVDISKDIIVGAAATITGVVDLNSTTDSTSSTTGALQIAGGVGIAKNVYIGAGLSVAGTLTYEDVTNVDSVGLITAKSGVNITGGQLQVGVAYSVGSAGVATAAGFVGPLTGNVTGTASNATNFTVADESSDTTCFPVFVTAATGDLPPKSGSNLTFNSSTGALTAGSFVGNINGNVTGNLNGTVNTGSQTNITSLGTLTGLTVNGATSVAGGGEFKVGTGVTISSTAGVTTFSKDVIFAGAAAANYVQWDQSASALKIADNTNLWLGNISGNGDLRLYHDGADSYVNSQGTGDLLIRGDDVRIQDAASGHNMGVFVEDGGVELYYNNGLRFAVNNDGTSTTGMSTVTTGAHFQGMLREDCNIVANKLSAGTNIDLANGMLHYYSTNETTTATPNIRWNSTYSLNNKMSTGEAVTVTIIYKPNGAGYYAALTVDGSGVTEEWNGGAAPSAANAGGYDVLTHTLVKTGSGSFICLSNVQNYA